MPMTRPPTKTTAPQAELAALSLTCGVVAGATEEAGTTAAAIALYAGQPMLAAGIYLVTQGVSFVSLGLGLCFSVAGLFADGPRTENINVAEIRAKGLIPKDKLEERLSYIDYHPTKVHIAITGASGAGKSTFLNSVRGLLSHQSGFAKVGRVETTVGMHRYVDPDIPWLAWYDMAGAGTPSVKTEDYFYNSTLFAFDCIVIVWKGRVTEVMLDILSEAAKLPHKIPIFLVRSASDEFIKDIADTLKPAGQRKCWRPGYRNRCEHRKQAIALHRQETKETLEKTLGETSTAATFLISSRLMELLANPPDGISIPAPRRRTPQLPTRLSWLDLTLEVLREAVEDNEDNQEDAMEDFDVLDEQILLVAMFNGIAEMRNGGS